MREKITLDQFNYYREKLQSIIDSMNNDYEAATHEYDFNSESYFLKYRLDYEEVQKELFSYDLSDIPFKNWEGYCFLSEDPRINISNSRANLDFNLIKIDYKDIILTAHNCNIINLENSGLNIRKDNFDEKVIDSMFYEKEKIPSDVINDFFDKHLSIEEILKYSSNFPHTNFDNYYSNSSLRNFVRYAKPRSLQKIISKYKSYFESNLNTYEYAIELLVDKIRKQDSNANFDYELEFKNIVLKEFFKDYNLNLYYEEKPIPNWIFDMDIKVVGMVNTKEEFLKLDPDTTVFDRNLKHLILRYGVKNLQRLVKETNILDLKNKKSDLEIFQIIDSFLTDNVSTGQPTFADSLDYNSFEKDFAIILNNLRGYEQFTTQRLSLGYSYIKGKFRDKYSSIFISEDAPLELRELFYAGKINSRDLKENPDWIDFLRGKELTQSLNLDLITRKKSKELFSLLDFSDAMKLYIAKPKTLSKMISANKSQLLYHWYLKTGKKFIPDYTVMLEFPFEESDRFLNNGKKWSHFMKINRFSDMPEGRIVMLKLAYSFGVFDEDQTGIKKLEALLMDLPRQLPAMDVNVLENFLERNHYNFQKDYSDIITSLQKEGFGYDPSLSVFKQFYRFNDDGTASLKVSSQEYPKSSELLRKLFEEIGVKRSINYADAYRLFGGFKMEYNPEFRDFLLNNLDEIIDNPKYIEYVSKIQKRYNEIKTVNSNRHLTLDLAVSYVEKNKYENINLGNDKLAKVSSMAGYSQETFNTLQKIYNYGKIRTFNSIPKINNEYKKFHYETLDLDDPLALAIGTFTNCCQTLNDTAETCMEHSMTDKNGRIFVVKDELGNIVAQSWMWRNQNLICFDNIEVPTKTIDRAENKIEFTDDIYNTYKKAAHEMIELDHAKYKELYDLGKISETQYEELKLGKVTVGEGYNDILEAIKRNGVKDTDSAKPLHYEPPIELTRMLYISDSRSQYLLEKTPNSESPRYLDTLPIYSDDFKEYNDSNFGEKELLQIQKLELITEESNKDMQTELHDVSSGFVSKLAENYHSDKEHTRIIMNPNFAIVYEIKDDGVGIKDLLYNTKIDNSDQQIDITEEVAMQINLAFLKLSKYGDLDITKLDKSKLSMYSKAKKEEINFYQGGDRYAK